MSTARVWLQVFMILAFIGASISPACAFISGKSMAEICGADGLIKTFSVDPALAGFLPKSPGTPVQKDIKKDCAYCFAAAHGQALSAPTILLDFPELAGYLRLSGGVYAPLGQNLKPFDSQGPPRLVI